MPGANVKYVVPHHYVPGASNRFSLRSLVVKDRGTLTIRHEGALIKQRKVRHIKPAEMLHVTVSPDDLAELGENGKLPALELAIE